MKQFIYVILFPLLCSSGLMAQQNFSKTIDLEQGSNTGLQVKALNNSYLVLGGSFCDNNSKLCTSLVKTNTNGNTMWSRNYKHEEGHLKPGGTDALLEIEDGFLITGELNIPNSDQASDIFLLKVDEQGERIWMKTYGTANAESGRSIIPTQDGGYLLYGQENVTPNKKDILLLKLNADFELEWKQHYGQDFRLSESSNIVALPDGHFLLSYMSYPWEIPSNALRAVLQKIDANGTVLWTKQFEGIEYETIVSKVLVLNNEKIVVAWARNELDFSLYRVPPVVYALDANGEQLWEHTFSSSFEYKKCILNLRQTSDGDILGVGLDAGFEHVDTDGGWVFRLSPDGALRWERRFHQSGGFEPSASPLYDIVEDEDQNLIACGLFQDTFANAQPTINDPNIWLLKISAEGCLHQDCPSEQIITSVAALPTVEQRLLVYPNPVENQLTIELPHPPSASRPTALSVFNQQGQLLRSLQLKQQQTTLSLAELSPGSYFLRAQPLQKNLVFTTQIIKL